MAKTKPNTQTEPTPETDTPSAGYTVLARRYRPQQFSDLIGQEHVAQALSNALVSGRVAHAYLFTGSRGVGKTSSARILAKALNCVHGPTPTPCDQCEICLSIAGGDDVDVLEIDGASNNKVDEIRDLRQNVGFRPTRARYKIYIIDEVHMLSNSAFNALLKTLEEPPAHVKFIFATTEVQKIPITILSRCQRFDFSSVTPIKIFETLQHIVKKEGLQADADALRIVAYRANGSMRDSQTLLDQLLGFSQGPLTVETVHALLGTAGDDRLCELTAAIWDGDTATCLQKLREAHEEGSQTGELLDQLIEYWRGAMLGAVDPSALELLNLAPTIQTQLQKQLPSWNVDSILMGLDILTTAKQRMRGSTMAVVLLEIAVVRLSRLVDLVAVSELAQQLRGGNSSGSSAIRRPVVPRNATPPAVRSSPVPAPEKKKRLK